MILVRFVPANDEEKEGYKEYFRYLSEKKRFGVVGNGAAVIKDMYIIPLPSHESLPHALKPYRHKGRSHFVGKSLNDVTSIMRLVYFFYCSVFYQEIFNL